MNWSNLSESLAAQKAFSDLFFEASSLTNEQREEQLKTLVLALHSEATGIVESVNYKDHRCASEPVDKAKILYKTVDAYRYILAILNLWEIDGNNFAAALSQKDDFLHYRHRLSGRQWQGQPVAIFDMDDVLANFRKSFCEWSSKKCGHFIDPESDEYYNVREFKRLGVNSEGYFKEFMDCHGLAMLERDEAYIDLLNYLKDKGFWIQILTSRPSNELACFYDTYTWLKRNDIDADGVAFAPEKFIWLSKQVFYSTGKYFAIDDSAKHAAEYAKHGVKVLVPEKSYNQEVRGINNVVYVPSGRNPVEFIPTL